MSERVQTPRDLEARCREFAEGIESPLHRDEVAARLLAFARGLVEEARGEGARAAVFKVTEFLDAKIKDEAVNVQQRASYIVLRRSLSLWDPAAALAGRTSSEAALAPSASPPHAEAPHLKFKDWPEKVKELKADIRRSEKLTGADLATRIGGASSPEPEPPWGRGHEAKCAKHGLWIPAHWGCPTCTREREAASPEPALRCDNPKCGRPITGEVFCSPSCAPAGEEPAPAEPPRQSEEK